MFKYEFFSHATAEDGDDDTAFEVMADNIDDCHVALMKFLDQDFFTTWIDRDGDADRFRVESSMYGEVLGVVYVSVEHAMAE